MILALSSKGEDKNIFFKMYNALVNKHCMCPTADDFRTLISESADSPYQIVKLLEEMDISEMILRSIHNLLSCEGFKVSKKLTS